MADPFPCHHILDVLYFWAILVISWKSYQWYMHVWWITLPASSVSLLVTEPVGFSHDTRDSDTSSGNISRQTIWCAPVDSGVG